jgi:AraC-like DNA-binding protein
VEPYKEIIMLPYSKFPARAFITSTMDYFIDVHPHWHPEIEILYYISGHALQQANTNLFTAVAGDIIILGQDQLHSTYTIGRDDCKILVIQFDALNLGFPDKTTIENTAFGKDANCQNPIKSATAEGQILLQNILEIYSEIERKESAYEDVVKAVIYKLSGLLKRFDLYYVQKSEENMYNTRVMLKKTFDLIDQSFSREISLSQAAVTSSLSVSHFCRLFKKSTGMSFHEYLTFYRINMAVKMLNPMKKLADVAFDCGFGSLSSFIKNFKKYKGCAPSKYTSGEDA